MDEGLLSDRLVVSERREASIDDSPEGVARSSSSLVAGSLCVCWESRRFYL